MMGCLPLPSCAQHGSPLPFMPRGSAARDPHMLVDLRFGFIVCFKICLSGIQPGPGVLQRRKTVLEMEEPPVGVKWGEEHENVILMCCQC